MMFSVCCHPEILLPWQRDVTTSPLYSLVVLSLKKKRLGTPQSFQLSQGRRYLSARAHWVKRRRS